MRLNRVWTCVLVCSFLVGGFSMRLLAADSSVYGPGIGADNLGNTVVGGQWNTIVSYRYRASYSAPLSSIQIFLIPNVQGYANGTGGRIQVSVETDDGTSNHNPSGTVLSSYIINGTSSLSPSPNFPVIPFSSQPNLSAGQIYHFVFTNIDALPLFNYLSVDSLYQRTSPSPTQPTMSDVNCAVLMKEGTNAWVERGSYTPVLQLNYANGLTEGIGYMEVWSGSPQNISGSSAVRETFTVSGSNRTVTSFSVRVTRISGNNPLVVRLENGNGTLIEEGYVEASSIPQSSYGWATYTFESSHTLLAGDTYHLDLEASSTSTYQVFPIRKGSLENFQSTTFFPDGYAQFKQGGPEGSWVGWTQWGQTNRTDGDLQFYFNLN